jgi:glutamate--cysteine ligase
MPKGRYGVMKAYMPKVGTHGLQMMFRTCTIQVNLDFASEPTWCEDARGAGAAAGRHRAVRLLALLRGQAQRLRQLARAGVADVDRARSGMLPFVFEDGFGFERYVDYALDVPMYFVYRDGATSTPPASPSATSSTASCRRCPARFRRCRTGPTI